MKDLTNQIFGRLVALYSIEKRSKDGHVVWFCRCSCGNMTEVRGCDLLSGNTQSCGCLQKEIVSNLKSAFKHGDAKKGNVTRHYKIWGGMNQRCFNPNEPAYKYYGGRGISICKEWLNNYKAFKTWAMANGYADDLTIDRIDNDGDYDPDNCHWITKSENTTKNNRTRIRKLRPT